MTITKDRGTPVATKKPPATRKTSLYRLRCSGSPAEEDLASFVLASYLDRKDFTSSLVDHRGVRGLLVTGTIAPGGAAWCNPLSALTDVAVAEENKTASGLLLVQTEKHIYGLAYGLGFQMINPARIDPTACSLCSWRARPKG